MNMPIVLAILGALVLAAGIGLIYLPAGVIAVGVLTLAGAYAVGYLKARQ